MIKVKFYINVLRTGPNQPFQSIGPRIGVESDSVNFLKLLMGQNQNKFEKSNLTLQNRVTPSFSNHVIVLLKGWRLRMN